eukprot:6213173-Pleurochrysis_carterae.AAC.3
MRRWRQRHTRCYVPIWACRSGHTEPNKSARRDRNGYGPNVCLNERRALSACCSLCSMEDFGWAGGAVGGDGGVKVGVVGVGAVSIAGDGRGAVDRSSG